VVAALIATLGARPRERDSAIGAILAFGLGVGVLLLGFYQGFATVATNILFGNIFGVSGSQLLILVAIGLLVVAVMATWYRPLLFASIDPEAAEARGVPVRRLGLMFLVVLALTVTGAAQVVGTLLVLSLAITPAAAAQRLSASPLAVAALSVLFAVAAADGGLLASFGASNVKASVFITSISFAIYLAARLTGPRLRDSRQRSRENRRVQSRDRAYVRHVPRLAGTGTPRNDERGGHLDRHVPRARLAGRPGWPPRDHSPASQGRLALPRRRGTVLAPDTGRRLQACLASEPGSRSSCSSRRTRASSSSRSSR